MNTTCRLTYAAKSDMGRVRTANDDRWYADLERGLFLVADGMGGTSAGDLAADLAIKCFPRMCEVILDAHSSNSEQREASLYNQVQTLSALIHEESSRSPGLNGMGSTLVAAIVSPSHATIAHLGDSRAYYFVGGSLRRLTQDHNLLTLLQSDTSLGEGDDSSRSRLTRFLGMPGVAKPEVATINFSESAMMLLCTDGLTSQVSDDDIVDILKSSRGLDNAAESLVDLANYRGGADNVTVLLIAFDLAGN